MSLKKYLLESENFRFIHLFDTNELSMRDECMLSYLIELADDKKCDYRQMEITTKYIQIRKPNWKDRDIKESLKSLCELGYINLEGNHGRGNCYTLNIDFIEEKLFDSNTDVEESEKPTLKNYESDIKNLTGRHKDFNNTTLKNCESDIEKFNTFNNISITYQEHNQEHNQYHNESNDSLAVETSSTAYNNEGEMLNFSEFNSNINKPVKNLTKEGSTLENEKNIYVDKAADPAPKKDTVNSKGYKALMEYIDGTTYSFETKEELKKWYNEVGKGRVSVNQLNDKLKDLYEQVGGDEVKTRETIHRSYINNYMAFNPVNSNNSFNNFGKIDTIHTSHKVAEPQKKVERKDSVTKEMLMTHEEFESEVRAGNVKGVGIDEKGRIYF